MEVDVLPVLYEKCVPRRGDGVHPFRLEHWRLPGNWPGGNAVQGSVSFTDEDKDNCTIVIPRMHLHLREWWSRIENHPDVQASGHTVVIYPWMWTEADESKFKTSFTGVVCQAGDVRLTLPVIPHGSTGPTTRLRRTMMPWFGVIREDHERMETAEAGTWSEIADAHRDLSIGTRKPSGESSQKRAVRPYSFPGVTHLTGLGDLSDALLGRIKWSEWSVVAELDALFSEDKEAAHCGSCSGASALPVSLWKPLCELFRPKNLHTVNDPTSTF